MAYPTTYLDNGKTLSNDSVIIRVRSKTRENINFLCKQKGMTSITYLEFLIEDQLKEHRKDNFKKDSR